ncbi:MAG TPA: glycosyltransferase [Solirubrobacteraceae bacterium]|nr:glycosyltransferase [Solirubrobacteraceae bacterium]
MTDDRRDGATTPGISACVVCRNEADRIRPCLASLDWVDEIVVMDLQSSDESARIARAHGATVIRREPLPIVEPLRNEIAAHARHEWILALDPDERVTPGLAHELRRLAARDDIDAVVVPRMNVDLGHAPSSPVQRYEGQLRMYRRDRVDWPLFPNTLPVVAADRVYRLAEDDRLVLVHERNRTLPEALERAMRYAPAEATAMIESGQVFSAASMGRVLLNAIDRQFIEARAWNDGVPGIFRAAILVNYKLSVWIAFWQASGAKRTQSDDRVVLIAGRTAEVVWRAARLLSRCVRSGAGLGRHDARTASQPGEDLFPAHPQMRGPGPRVSIVITNHNYGRFLTAAISSALAQEGVDLEVIVVDDGSTDDSRAIIDRYGGQVCPLLQENRGQKAAFNAAMEIVSGDVVLFLDADDELKPGTAVAVADAFAATPGASRVVFRLAVVDETGRPNGSIVPSAGVALPHGDVRRAVLAFADDLAWPPTSGNAFAAWALRRVMPLPVDDDPIGADAWLHPLIPLLGLVVALERVGGNYRVHGANAHTRERLDVGRSRQVLRWASGVHAQLDRLARELGHGSARPRSVTLAAHRMVSLRIGGPGHPIAGDTRASALGAGLRAAAGRTDVPVLRRCGYGMWFVAAAVTPPPIVRALAQAAFQSVRGDRVIGRLMRR